jgi:hypothetical protein
MFLAHHLCYLTCTNCHNCQQGSIKIQSFGEFSMYSICCLCFWRPKCWESNACWLCIDSWKSRTIKSWICSCKFDIDKIQVLEIVENVSYCWKRVLYLYNNVVNISIYHLDKFANNSINVKYLLTNFKAPYSMIFNTLFKHYCLTLLF